jgi:thioredoxin reductase (NADPH)
MITSQDLKSVTAFKGLDDGALALTASRSADMHVVAGEVVIAEGDAPHFFAVLSGALEVSKRTGETSTVLTTYETGDTFGEVPLMLGSPAFATVRATAPSRLSALETTEFWRLMRTQESFAKAVSANMSTRITMLGSTTMQVPAACTIVGDPNSPDCHRLRDFLTRLDVRFDWEERSGPLSEVAFPDGRRLVSPTVRQLAEALGLPTRPQGHCYDVAIIGAGPAGLAAAVYGASEGLRTVLVDQDAPGGQAGMSSRIENYLGFPNGISGEDLADRAFRQAKRFGADVVVAREAIRIEGAPYDRRVVLKDEEETIHCRSIVLATGVCYRYLDARGCGDFLNRGIFYGAAQAEARHVRGRRIHLLGGGNSAGQAAMFFSLFADHVSIIVRGADLTKSMSQYLIEELQTRPNVSVIANSEVVAADGRRELETLVLRNAVDGTERHEPTHGLFVFIGADPNTEWLKNFVATDERGFVLTGESAAGANLRWPLTRPPFLLETNEPGVFAVGDVREGSVKRVASGVGEGATAITMVHQILAEQQAGLTPQPASV